jgi:hypothetical protein
MRVPWVIRAAVKVLRLPASERRMVLVAIAQLTRASIELRAFRGRRTIALLGVLQSPEPLDSAAREHLRDAELVGRSVTRVASKLPWRPTCLPQALAAKRMLARRGIASELHLGVTSPTVGQAHAWVTVDGQPVVGRAGLEQFVPLTLQPPAASAAR